MVNNGHMNMFYTSFIQMCTEYTDISNIYIIYILHVTQSTFRLIRDTQVALITVISGIHLHQYNLYE